MPDHDIVRDIDDILTPTKSAPWWHKLRRVVFIGYFGGLFVVVVISAIFQIPVGLLGRNKRKD